MPYFANGLQPVGRKLTGSCPTITTPLPAYGFSHTEIGTHRLENLTIT